MVTVNRDLFYTTATDSELDDLLVGREAGMSVAMLAAAPQHLHSGSTGVIWVRPEPPDTTVRPLAIISREDDLRRLCGRYAHLRSDLSPLSAWCHLVTPKFFESITSIWKDPFLAGVDAAWSGLVIAEAVIASERPLRNVRLPACLATQSFAVARTKALWGHIGLDPILERVATANKLVKNDRSGKNDRVRAAFMPVWRALIGLSANERVSDGSIQPLVDALRGLQHARLDRASREVDTFVRPLIHLIPEATDFLSLNTQPPETRLRLFDALIADLESQRGASESLRRNAVGLLAGYLATVAAGGAPSLSLVEANAKRWPELTAWAYVVGGIGEKIAWASGFDGLGRLVARELARPFRLDEPPVCDFMLDEAMATVDPQVTDPLVHLRLKQARIATIALYPGVNVCVPLSESAAQDREKPESRPAPRRDTERTGAGEHVLASLADALWPFLQRKLESEAGSASQKDSYDSQRNKNRKKSNQRLPWSDTKR